MHAPFARAFLSALVVVISLGNAARADEREPIGGGLEAAPKPTFKHGSFGGQRPWLDSLSAADQVLLARLITEYVNLSPDATGTGKVVRVHSETMTTPSLMSVHRADYSKLFSWHRTYIAGLETFLKQKGYARFVPLPKWDPASPIPVAFARDGKGKTVIDKLDPKVDWRAFETSRLSKFSSDVRKFPADTTPAAEILADTLVVLHNTTHNTVGGGMASMRSPSVPIFWAYHAFIDDVAYDWQHKPKGPLQAPPPRTGILEESAAAPSRVNGTVRVVDGTVFLDSAKGSFTLAGSESLLGALRQAEGRSVWIDAMVDLDLTATVIDVHASSRGMEDMSVRSAPPPQFGFLGIDFGFLASIFGDRSKENGKLRGMDEVKVVGAKGAWLEVIVNDDVRGWVPAKRLEVGQSVEKPGEAAHTHGVAGAMSCKDGKCSCCK